MQGCNSVSSEQLSKIRNKVTPPLYFVLKTWLNIRNELRQLTEWEHLRKLSPNYMYKEQDEALTESFCMIVQLYEKRQKSLVFQISYPEDDDPKKDEYWDLFRSIRIIYENYWFSFPSQCRQWPKTNLLDRIFDQLQLKYKETKERVDIPTWLKIWMQERRKEIIPLSETDILILRYIANFGTANKSSYFVDSQKIASYYNRSKKNIADRILRLWIKDVLRCTYIVNVAKLGFTTLLAKKSDIIPYSNILKLDHLILGKLNLEQNNNLFLIQIPTEYVETYFNPATIEQVSSFSIGYSISQRTGLSQFIPIPLQQLLEQDSIITRTAYQMSLNPDDSYLLKLPDLKLLEHFCPAYYNLTYRPEHIAEKYKVSTTTIHNKLTDFFKHKILYPYVSIKYIGYPIPLLLYIKAKPKLILKLKDYLSQYFQYLYYSNENTLFAYLNVNNSQYSYLKQQIASIQSSFYDFALNEINITKLQENYIKRSINWKKLSYSVDDHFGLCWTLKNSE